VQIDHYCSSSDGNWYYYNRHQEEWNLTRTARVQGELGHENQQDKLNTNCIVASGVEWYQTSTFCSTRCQ